MRNRTLALIVTVTALTSVLASCDLVDMTGLGQPSPIPDCSGVSISVVGYSGYWGQQFNDTLTVGDSVPLQAYTSHAEQWPSDFGGTYWTCVQSDVPLTVGISWSSDDARVATVVNGMLRALQPGSTVIHFAVNGGGAAQSASLPLVVIAPAQAEARAISSRLLAPHGREVRSRIHRERGLAGDGLPHQPIGHDLGALITRTPALEDA
jgi:hypothetical protein